MSASPAESPSSQISEPIFDKYAEDSEDRSSRSAAETPGSELSPPDSPAAKSITLADDKRANARSLAASLSLEEQVGTASIPTLVSFDIYIKCRYHFSQLQTSGDQKPSQKRAYQVRHLNAILQVSGTFMASNSPITGVFQCFVEAGAISSQNILGVVC